MKKKTEAVDRSITGAIVKPLADLHEANTEKLSKVPSIGSTPLMPAAEYQDDGGRYDTGYVIPQK